MVDQPGSQGHEEEGGGGRDLTDINATKTTWRDCVTLLKGGIGTSPDTQRPLLDTIPKGLYPGSSAEPGSQ